MNRVIRLAVEGLQVVTLGALLLAATGLGLDEAEAAKTSYFYNNEVRSSNLAPFPKWNEVLRRYASQKREAGNSECGPKRLRSCEVKRWHAMLNKLRSAPLREKMEAINRYFNQRPYILDPQNWGKNDYWATPYEFFVFNGDCEDYAIAKYLSLRELGVSTSAMRIVVLQDFNLGGIMHAVLEVKVEGEPYILDNQVAQVRAASRIYHYKPIYSINESSWWAHRY